MQIVSHIVEMSRALSGVSPLSDSTVVFDSSSQVRFQFRIQLNGATFSVTAPYPSLQIYDEDYTLLLTQTFVPGVSGWTDENAAIGYIAIVVNGASPAFNVLKYANHKLNWVLTGKFGGQIDLGAMTGQMLFSRVNPVVVPPATEGVTRDYANLNDAYAAAALASFNVNDYVYISGVSPYEGQRGVWKVIATPGTDFSQYTRVLDVQVDINYPVGPAGGDLGGTYPNPSVSTVGGVAANTVAAAGVAVANATSTNVINTLVKRDGTGAIYATLHGTADSVDWVGVSNTPVTLAGYGINDAAPKGLVTSSGLTSNTNKLLGRSTAGLGGVEEIAPGTGITISAGVISVTASTYQPIDATLTAIAAVTGVGYLKWTGVDTMSLVTSIQWSEISGVPSYQPLDPVLTSLASTSPVSNSLVLSTGVDTLSIGKLTNDYVAVGAAIDWSKISKGGATPADIGAAANGAVTASGLTVSTSKLLGRTTAGPGAIEEISIGSGLTFSGGVIAATASTPTWGGIVGTISSQTDLQTALLGKQPLDATLTALSNVISAGNTLILSNGFDVYTAGQLSDAYVSPAANIAWSKINKTGAAAADVGAAANGSVTTSGLTLGTARLLGRTTAGPGAIEEISIGAGLTLSGGTLSSAASAPTWGGIAGTLSDQTDLNSALSGKQAADTTLSALASLTGTGYAKWTATDTVGMVTTIPWGDVSGAPAFITGVAWGGITGTLSNQTDLNSALSGKQASDATLTALASLTGAGYAKWTGTDTVGMVATIPWGDVSGAPAFITGVAWGSITGTLSNQTDLNSALSGKQASSTILTTLSALANASGVLRNNGSGTLSYDNTVTTQGNTFNGNTQLVQTTAAGALPALSAANLTSIPAGNLTGSVADARLSANVAFYDRTTAFTQAQSITNPGAVLLSVTSTLAPGSGSGGFVVLACNDGATTMGNTYRLGGLLFTGRDGAGVSRNAAGVVAYAAENWNTTSAGAYLTFETTNNTTNTRTAKLFISDSGSVGIGALTTAGQAMLVVPASTTARASLNIPTTGVAPTSPNNGDIWAVSTNLLVRIGGVSQSLITGTGAANQISYWSAANTQTGSSGFTATLTSGAVLLSLGQTTTATSATNLASFTLTANPASAASGTFAAGDFTVSTSSAAGANFASNSLMAFRTTVNANTSVTGTLTGIYGNRGVIAVLNSGSSGTTWTVGSVYGYISDTSVTTTNVGATSTISNYYAIYLPTPSFAGSGTSSITSRYGIFQADPASTNIFAGPTTVGTLTATAPQLIVQGGASGSAMIRLSRTSGGTATYAWALVGGGLSFTDEVAGFTTTNIFGDSNINQMYLGQRLVTAANTRACLLGATSFGPTAGTDVPGVNLIIQGSLGTGAGATGSVIIRSAVLGSTGTATQATVDRITLVDSGFKLANSTGAGYNFMFSDGANSFRSVVSTSFTDSVASTFFQVGSVNGNASFTAQNGSIYNRVLFIASKFVIADVAFGSAVVPTGLFEIYNSAAALRFRVNNVSGSAYIQTPASTTTNASINLPHGVAPTTPVDGDVWTATTGLYAQINGSTVGPYGTGGGGATWGSITGTLSNQLDLQAELDNKASIVDSLVNALIFG